MGRSGMGLSEAFLTAGSRAVIASQWRVEDTAAEVFMGALYDLLEDRLLVSAFCDTQRLFLSGRAKGSLRHAHTFRDLSGPYYPQPENKGVPEVDYALPYYWGAFVLILGSD